MLARLAHDNVCMRSLALTTEAQRRQARTLHDVSRYLEADEHSITQRIHELQREWDVTRTLEANVGGIALAGLVLGILADRRFLILSFAASAVLLQQALLGRCPPLPLLRRLGIRTAAEIHQEILALRILRGDFVGPLTYPESLLAVAGQH